MGAFSKIFVAALAVGGRLAVADDSDKCRDAHKDEATCKKDSACSWCKSAAVPSSCNSKENAKNLPPAVFDCSASSAAGAALTSAQSQETVSFESFLLEHGKAYAAQEEHLMRKAIFEANMKKVLAHNEEYEAGKHTWYMAMNHLADLTPEEFQRLRAKKKGEGWGNSRQVQLTATAKANVSNPASIDWRSKNVVTPVKNQGGCGSCWAFAATETMESHYAIATGKLLTLAPQAYVNCVKNPKGCGGQGGCEGATEELAFNTSAALGLPLESDMPYEGSDAKCGTYKSAVKNTGFVKNPVNDAAAFETALATKGPMAITVAAGQWQLYGGGVFEGCTGSDGADLDHGVQAVGYTPTYWIVRNSWGASWGEKGYIYVSRKGDDKSAEDTNPSDGVACGPPFPKSQTVKGECGILSDTSYPTFAKLDEEIVV